MAFGYFWTYAKCIVDISTRIEKGICELEIIVTWCLLVEEANPPLFPHHILSLLPTYLAQGSLQDLILCIMHLSPFSVAAQKCVKLPPYTTIAPVFHATIMDLVLPEQTFQQHKVSIWLGPMYCFAFDCSCIGNLVLFYIFPPYLSITY